MLWWWIVILGLPLLTASLLCADAPTRRVARALAPYTALPALGAAVAWPVDRFVAAEWFMLGAEFGLDQVGQLFMLLVASLWTVAAFYSRAYLKGHPTSEGQSRGTPRADRYWLFFLLTMTGNIGLVASYDIASFYLFFTLMTFAAFGLVVHDGSDFAHYAAKVYIAMAIFGEALLLMGFVMLASALPQWIVHELPENLLLHTQSGIVIALLFAGFGVKAGVILLHMWLPLAHPAAPTPASAVLSGAMIKAGLLGWLRFLPGGVEPLMIFGLGVMILGALAAFYGIILGLFQTNPKTNLAYSSVSQMGFMTIGLGIALALPELWETALLVLSLYALHHAMAKGALFLSVGIAHHGVTRAWHAVALYVGVAVAALSLAGVPLTSGYMAKTMLKSLGSDLPGQWLWWLNLVLPVAAVGTTVLMGRFFWLVYRAQAQAKDARAGLWPPWIVLLILVIGLTWVVPTWYRLDALEPPELAWDALWLGFWPVGFGLVIVMIAIWRRWAFVERRAFPAGDILLPVLWLSQSLARSWQGVVIPVSIEVSERAHRLRNRGLLATARLMSASETVIVRWGAGGVMFLLMILLFIVVLILS